MKHDTPAYVRKGRVLREVASDKSEKLQSISAAKRRSRELQQQNGGLGMGYVRVDRR